MNTKAKGDKFEDLCFKLLNERLGDEVIFCRKGNCKILKQQGYFGKLRNRKIKFDLSVEYWPQGASTYSFLFLIECKNYKGKVSVGRIEEFISKVRQVREFSVKPILFTSNGIQDGVYETAKNAHVGLIDVSKNGDYQIILHKTLRTLQENSRIILPNKDEELVINNIREEIEKVFKDLSTKTTEAKPVKKIPFLTKSQIENRANNILREFGFKAQTHGSMYDFDAFLSFVKKRYKLSITDEPINESDSLGRPIVSLCDFSKNRIVINTKLIRPDNYRFYVAHELGHYFLHKNIGLTQQAYDGFKDSEMNYISGKHEISNERQWLEWQANKFAAALILPKVAFLNRFYQLKKDENLFPLQNPFFLDKQICNISSFLRICEGLDSTFKVSTSSAKYRMKEFGLLTESKKEPKHISQFADDFFKSLGRVSDSSPIKIRPASNQSR